MRLTSLVLLLSMILPVFAGELPAPPGSSTNRGMYGSITSIQNHVIAPAAEAQQWLTENPFFPEAEEWKRVIAINEIYYLHTALKYAVEDKNAEMGNLVMARLRVICPNITRLNLRNPAVLNRVSNFYEISAVPLPAEFIKKQTGFTYTHPKEILKVKANGLRFRTAAEAAAGGVITEKPAGTEFLDPPPETDFLGNPTNPTTPEASRRR
jgi:hypothetical protein